MPTSLQEPWADTWSVSTEAGGGWACLWARLPGTLGWSRHFEVPDIYGETIWSEVSLVSALLHTPCHLISPSILPTPRFVNLPCLLYEVRCQCELDSVSAHELFFPPSSHPQKHSITTSLLPKGKKSAEGEPPFHFPLKLEKGLVWMPVDFIFPKLVQLLHCLGQRKPLVLSSFPQTHASSLACSPTGTCTESPM